MPEISRFYGIVIRMYVKQKEHNPPHIHAYYGEYKIEIEIKTLKIIKGKLPKKALHLVLEWLKLHQEELLIIWNNQEFKKIEPLE